MAGNKKINSDLEVLGKGLIHTVPNATGTVMTYNTTSKELSTRTNAEIISDLGLITATNIAASYYTKTQLQTSGQAQVNWGNLTNVPSTFPATAHTHDDRYYTETESDTKFVPYTGATSNVNLNNKNLYTTGSVYHHSNHASHIASTSLSGTGIIDIKLPNFNIMATLYIDVFTYGVMTGTFICQLYTYYGSSRDYAGSSTVTFLGKNSNNIPFSYVTIGLDNFAERHIYIGNLTTSWGSHTTISIRGLGNVNFSQLMLNPLPITVITSEPENLKVSRTITDFSIESALKVQRTVGAGSGLIGGGLLTEDRTLALGTPSSINAKSTNSVTSTSHSHSLETTPGADFINILNNNETGFHSGYLNAPMDGAYNVMGISVPRTGDPAYSSVIAFRSSRLFLRSKENNIIQPWVEFWGSNHFTQTDIESWNNASTNNHTHSNKAFLDTVNQNLGTTHSPTFNGITTGYVSSTFKGFNSSTPFSFLNVTQAQQIYTGGILASDTYTDAQFIPGNGIYSKGNIHTVGKIGIGRPPSASLDVSGALKLRVAEDTSNVRGFEFIPAVHNANNIIRTYGSSGGLLLEAMSTASGNTQSRMNFNPGGFITLETNSGSAAVERLRISPLGNVGIGTDSPTEKLHVVGNILATGFKIPSGTASQFLKANGTLDSNSYSLSTHDHDTRYYTKPEVDAMFTASEADKYKTTITQSGEVEHMLNTYDVTVEFYDTSTMFTVGARVQRLTTNKIKVEFDTPPANPIKVLIRKF